MKLHTNKLTADDVHAALNLSKIAGLIDSRVGFEELGHKGSRTHSHAFEVQLGWYGDKVKGDGRRYKNSGNGGAADTYAATRNEWGEFIAYLLSRDPEAVFGPYKGEQHFHEATGYVYGGGS